MRVLICEESPTLALDLWWLLHEQGHSICGIARSRMDGLEKTARSDPDLVMVDEDLEGRRGRDLVEALSRTDVPAVMISGDAKSAAGATSARAVLPKPFTEGALTSVMARVERPSERRVPAE
jgi:DNA-binding response OmpR family regulator